VGLARLALTGADWRFFFVARPPPFFVEKTRVDIPDIVGISINLVLLFTSSRPLLAVTVVSELFLNACLSFTIYFFLCVVLCPKSALGRLFLGF
jgi:hypothetical protein